ncbi:helix-hairpin-helix domain-containing protein [uncultured Tenacibaculum sp.]|uniref:ComEA family DNA-binding protein n=1 Tax=uncultured Tenacibaculum sp. TaxID=174713 RepID=UPI00260338CA|nr:helix-hairpin-helix domain-containing protein [uncultured Tenacibaculum sp.]
MKNFKSHFWYSKSQRNGILFLALLIILFQLLYFFIDVSPESELPINTEEIVRLQSEIDSLRKEKEERLNKIYPFNPNYISDFKGEKLGMSLQEIDRLHAFRKQNKFVNSASEFQSVTKVSDSLLNVISPYFKFPDWVVKKQKHKSKQTLTTSVIVEDNETAEKEISTNDINKANVNDFTIVNGVGEVISKRIIKYRSKLKGFSFKDQLYEIWGLEKELADEILKTFIIKEKPNIEKINVNTASFKEILNLPYIDYNLCKKIFDYRDEVAELQDIKELRNIKDFPQNKYDRIVLYLKAE